MKISSIALAATLFCAQLQAQVLEDFEAGNLGAYTVASSGTNATVTAGAAYSGNLGLEFLSGSAGWYYRTDVSAQPGDMIRVMVQGNGSGRSYVGFGASASGCWSAVVATNTSELLLQQNSGYGYSDMSSAPQTYPGAVWNLVEIDWALNGMVVVNLYDELGVTLLASTPPAQGPTVAGGIAFRGFASGSDAFYVDDITKNFSSFPSYCSGSDPNPGCPCGNQNNGSNPDAGCANASSAVGAILEITGQPVISAQTLQLVAAELPPNTTGIFFQGTTLSNGGVGTFLGDGRLCAGGQLVRLQVQMSDAQGGIQTSANIAAVGGVTVPGTRVYQLWYKDSTSGPCGSGVNLTNAREVTWVP